jgi:hypothetical protein
MYANGRSYDSAGHEYDRGMITHRSCGAHRWQRPADAATEFTTNT